MKNKSITEFVRKIVNCKTIEEARSFALDFLIESNVTEGKRIYAGSTSYLLSFSEYGIIQALILSNEKIKAIKELRAITYWGLKDAKDAVEDPENFSQRLM